MENSIRKFLEFNGRTIYFLQADGTYWIAVKPICEALGVNYDRQYKNLKADKIMSQLYAEQHIVAADGKLRKMICLPEMAVYGWLFRINSNAPGFEEYCWKCYQVLYDFFHGTITGRRQRLIERAQLENEKLELEKRLTEQNPEFARYCEISKQMRQINQTLRGLDQDLMAGQLSLF